MNNLKQAQLLHDYIKYLNTLDITDEVLQLYIETISELNKINIPTYHPKLKNVKDNSIKDYVENILQIIPLQIKREIKLRTLL